MKSALTRYAPYLALLTAVISGTANFVNKFAVTAAKDPIFFTTLKNGVVAVLLIGLLVAFRKWEEIRHLTGRQWAKLIAIAVVGGSVPFALFFTGLTQTSALNASLIHKTLFLWVALLAIPILKERLSFLQWIGVAALFGANLFVGGFTGFKFNLGELLILGATLLWAVENVIAKIALRDLSSGTVAAARMVLGSLVLLALSATRGSLGQITGLNPSQWGWVLLTGGLLSGYVWTWYTALKHAPATLVATLLVPATLVTNLLSAVFVTHELTPTQLTSGALFVIGATLMIVFARRTAEVPPAKKINLQQS